MSDRLFYKLCKHMLYAILMMLCVLSDDIVNKLNVIVIFLYIQMTINDGDD